MNLNKAQVLSLVRTILKTVGASLVTNGYMTDGSLELIIGIILAVAGVVWSHYAPEKKPESGGTSLPLVPVLATILALGSTTMFTGCQTIRDNPEIAKTVLRVGLRAATYAVTQKNPELSPYLSGVSDLLFNIPFAASPEQVNAKISELVDSKVSEPLYRDSLKDVTQLAVSFYSDVYARYKDQLSDAQLQAVLKAMGEAISQGLSSGTPAGPSGHTLVLESQTLVIVVE